MIPEELISKSEELREKLVESAAEADDSLMEKYLEKIHLAQKRSLTV